MSREARLKLVEMLRELKLPGVNAVYGEAAAQAEKEGWGFERFLHHLMEVELEQRRQKRLERVIKAAHIPPGKTLTTLKQDLLPVAVHPRVCGEQSAKADMIIAYYGSSPRVRGTVHQTRALGLCHRFIPACAGNRRRYPY